MGLKVSLQEEKSRTHTHTHARMHARREECHVKTEAETGVLWRQVTELELRNTKGFQQHQMLREREGGAWNRFSPKAYKSMALLKPSFLTSGIQNYERRISVVLSHPVYGTLFQQRRKPAP